MASLLTEGTDSQTICKSKPIDIEKYVFNENKVYLDSFVLFGKHSSKEGSGRKSGEAGSTVCFFCLVLSALVVGGSNVNVALGTKAMEDGASSFFQAFEERPTTSNRGKNVELGNFD